jgi:scavenger receptor class B, member 1
MRPLFEKIPFPLVFKVYVFNITNSEDVLEGGKPILKEIGPYMFE